MARERKARPDESFHFLYGSCLGGDSPELEDDGMKTYIDQRIMDLHMAIKIFENCNNLELAKFVRGQLEDLLQEIRETKNAKGRM